MGGQQVLVTGGSGFLAAYCIARLLDQGHRVRTTVRSAAKQGVVREHVAAVRAAAGASGQDGGVDRLSFAVADLTADDGWARAADGCDHVLHVASPFPAAAPKDENALIVPAREGTLRVLRAARDAGVTRTVVTSSFAAIGYGHPATTRAFTERDWTDLSGPGVAPYIKSKTLAERAAWDFMEREGGAMELAVVNPVGIFGPAFGPDISSSLGIIKQMLDGGMPGVPNLAAAVVDVRDVADLHLLAMTSPRAAGERFIATAGDAVSFRHIARTLRERLGPAGGKVVTRPLPSPLVRVAARFVPRLGEITGNLDVVRHVDGTKARTVLGWTPRSSEDAVTATAVSLRELGLA
ncbi:aldehyde reductase [Actinocorallia sp. A-T 12471]|uniref:SDR family oxidoreductase n=1 Tax=Actinocorallia sp. A-T 12471 TaxID=3089813 RepID=UPI0029D00C71|nr:aldehyde reductase [Actinocorallia sp. A-T 12471]MDX6743954.1 aldehyde reductase [Actinocorallia sp. A-T 12471]